LDQIVTKKSHQLSSFVKRKKAQIKSPLGYVYLEPFPAPYAQAERKHNRTQTDKKMI
jgi:hypothetical protein